MRFCSSLVSPEYSPLYRRNDRRAASRLRSHRLQLFPFKHLLCSPLILLAFPFHLRRSSHLWSVQTPENRHNVPRHHPALPVPCCKSRFWGSAMISAVSSTRYVGTCRFPAAFIPLCRLGLFHPPLPAWRTSSCQSRFAFIHMMNRMVGEPLSSFLSRTHVPVCCASLDPAERRPAALNSCQSSVLNFHFLRLAVQCGSKVPFPIIAVTPENPPSHC